MWRVDNRNAWIESPHDYPAKKKIGEYFRENFYLTTSGNFRTQALIDAMLEIGADRIMFSTDWPFENIDHAAMWFDAAPISEADRMKIGRTNAVRLFKLAEQCGHRCKPGRCPVTWRSDKSTPATSNRGSSWINAFQTSVTRSRN